jgi:hypothetical protein
MMTHQDIWNEVKQGKTPTARTVRAHVAQLVRQGNKAEARKALEAYANRPRPTRRTSAEIDKARNDILAQADRNWKRLEGSQADLDALVRNGSLERKVKTEQDYLPSRSFGGVVAAIRKRAYYRTTT